MIVKIVPHDKFDKIQISEISSDQHFPAKLELKNKSVRFFRHPLQHNKIFISWKLEKYKISLEHLWGVEGVPKNAAIR